MGILGAAVGAGADGSATISVVVNGQTVTFDSAPMLINDHVYVPIRYVAQALGIPVTWDQANETVYLGNSQAGSTALGGSFAYEGLKYSAAGLQMREYPGQQNTSGAYWIVSYAITNTSAAPVDVATTQPALVLFGPGGVQLAPDSGNSGPGATTLNPGITYSSYDVFNVPTTAVPSAYSLGFNTYQVVNGQFTTSPVSASLAPSSSTTVQTPVGSTYSLQNVWNGAIQTLSIGQVVQSTAIVPELTPPSFDPTTSFWIVDFDITNPGPDSISFSASDFALDFNGGLSIPAAAVASLPGYVPATSLTSPGGVTVTEGNTFSGGLLFDVPANTPTANPGLALSVNGNTRVVSLQACNAGVCPPVQG